MPDPSVLTDMPVAAARLAEAVIRGEKVAIFGDYDVDGASSAALLARFLRHGGLDPIIHIPDRVFEGYGPNVEAIRSLRPPARRCWSRSIAAPPATSRWRKRSAWASTPS